MRTCRTRFAAWALCTALAAWVVPLGILGVLMGPQEVQAQNLGMRAVAGIVVDASEAPVSGATVFLKNLKTKSIRSFTSTADGRFRFAQVNMVEDYDLWAEKNGKKSSVKIVSSWDTRKDFEVELKLK